MFGEQETRRLYLVIQVVLLISLYVVPYLLLRNTIDLSLFFFWTIATVAAGITAIYSLERELNRRE